MSRGADADYSIVSLSRMLTSFTSLIISFVNDPRNTDDGRHWHYSHASVCKSNHTRGSRVRQAGRGRAGQIASAYSAWIRHMACRGWYDTVYLPAETNSPGMR